ncbi:hypothetical protein XH98_06555 [Bradyrhizobium sp. CCBAU 51745]|nr:hypothetical protein [Bradyrhizobium sp. CCBAU 51745]
MTRQPTPIGARPAIIEGQFVLTCRSPDARPCGVAKKEAVDGCQTKDPASRASQHRSLIRGTPRNVGLRRADVATDGSTPSDHRHLSRRSVPSSN